MPEDHERHQLSTAGGDWQDRCLSLTIRGPWAHFRRVEGNIVKQTYRVIPRTTVAGLLAAMLGIGRDQYYELFGPDQSLIAIEPVQPLRTINMPMNTLSTATEHLHSFNSRGKISVKLPDPSKPRQQHNYEVLVDPAYRIDISLADRGRYAELREMLAAGKSHYIPSLGLSEYLADVEYHGEFDIERGYGGDDSIVEVDSTIPNGVERVIPQADIRFEAEESPAFMTTDSGGRTTSGFAAYAYSPDAEALSVRDVEAARVDGRTVVFT
ncbi:type I-B CRISPR-associated protein Cas5 [Haloferax sp. MBLA0076]|uniref:Type I-B CRISPR-associated protein Cas5 n=1 Tax=Haloferax litoreum TaxID=2666140 RepID=A0A6A8GI63_9EURY|nr:MULTISPECIES: type I-B CRISPR-associated protein Cas5b [Haloferax]KAB1193636.1 type I-B CRISPR-associated protein Cas5 [Haloferax sp. CBA1148]MRX22162.1 type I-B CRISPR-associated protein Cas5 [Haloferax litoreum]